ncbi:MAG TPA: hypothetical protein VE075_00925 [Thermoanaerobaculia bacterium]|nr:hypothetical protein [Thermoanaerobaculia bacterium]
MPSESDHGHRSAFTADFLDRLDESAEPDGAHEADVAGPWAIRPVPYRGDTGFALLREWESLEAGDVPYAVFRRRETALLAAAVLPATGREPLFRLDTEPDADGFAVLAALARPRPARPAPTAQPARQAGPPIAASPEAPVARQEPPAPGSAPAASPPDAVGHLRDFDESLAGALHVAAALVRSPEALARLLEAAGYVTLEQVGRILDRRIRPA